MEESHHRRRETFQRLKVFSDNHPEIPTTTIWPQLVTGLGTVITNLDDLVAAEESNRGAKFSGTASREDARDNLREMVEAIVRTARAIGEDKPGFDEAYRMPRQGSDRDLVDQALGIAQIAAPNKADFISHAMPADFLEDLDEAIATLQKTMTDQSEGKAGVKSAGVSIDETVARGMAYRRQMNAVVRNFFRDNPAVLAEWETAYHIEKAPTKKKGPPPSSSTPNA
jgi:hypothetical protein